MTSCGSVLLKIHNEGPCEIIYLLSGSYCGITLTSVSKSTSCSSAISSNGAFEPIQVAPAVESTAKIHCPALRKLAGYEEILKVEKEPLLACFPISFNNEEVVSLKISIVPSLCEYGASSCFSIDISILSVDL